MEKPQANVTSAVRGMAKKRMGPERPIILFFIVGLVASLLIGWVSFPPLLYSTKRQPIDFNHASTWNW